MKLILQYLSEKIQELKSNNELKLAALSGFTFGVLFVAVMYNIYWVYKSRSRHQRLLMKNLILLFLLIPNLVMGGLNQNKTPEPVEGNPFELLKEIKWEEESEKTKANFIKKEKLLCKWIDFSYSWELENLQDIWIELWWSK